MFIDQAMYDCCVSLMERPLTLYSLTGEIPRGGGSDSYSPTLILQAKDGYVALNLPTDEMWRRFCSAIERVDLLEWPEFATATLRAVNLGEKGAPEAEVWTASRTRNQVVARFAEYGLPVGAVQDIGEVYECPQVRARGMLMDVPDATLDSDRLPRTPLTFEGFDGPASAAAPALGEHTETILRDLLGVSARELEALRKEGAI